MIPDYENDPIGPSDPEWEAEQRELAGMMSTADAWFDFCIRKLDPCDPVYWEDEPDSLDD